MANETPVLKAEPRELGSKGAVRSLRNKGFVPAVIYGDKKAPVPITLSYKEVTKEYHTGHFLSTLYQIEVDGKAERVIPRDIQLDPVRDFVLHVDFLRLGRNAKVAVNISVVFLNEDDSPGLREGGVLNIVRHEVELLCPASHIPESIEIDLTGKEMGDSIHISEVTLPDDVEPTITDRDFTIATIAAPAAVRSEEDEEAEAEAAEAEADGEEEGGDEEDGGEE